MSKCLKRAVAFSLVAFGLAGCVTPEQLRQQDEAACVSFGFQPNTPDFANCLQRESLLRRYQFGLYSSPGFGWYGPGWGYPGPFAPW